MTPEIEDKLQNLDRAFINSVLSYAIYTKNSSWFEKLVSHKIKHPENKLLPAELVAKEEIFKKESRAHDRVFAVMVSQFLMPANLMLATQDEHKSSNYNYKFDSQYKDGVYRALDNLSGACAMKSLNSDGTYTLHISFRGTDNQARPFSHYLAKAYPDMAAYYESFKPFEKACIDYAKDENNQISKIEVSGHSLGGAMVQHFCRSEEVKELKQPIEGITFGSPHAISNTLYSFLPAARHSLVNVSFKFMISTAMEVITLKPLRDRLFNRDERITQYQHSGDLIPKVAALFMSKLGKSIIELPDSVSNKPVVDHLLTNAKKDFYNDLKLDIDSPKTIFNQFKQMVFTAYDICIRKPTQKALRVLNVTYHDMARYSLNIENYASSLTETQNNLPFFKNEFKEITPFLHQYNRICASMRIHTKGNAQLNEEPVSFNEFVSPNKKFLAIGHNMIDKIRQSIAQKDANLSSESPLLKSSL